MTFLFPPALWVLLALPLLVFGYVRVVRRRAIGALRFLPLVAASRSTGAWPKVRRHLPAALLLLALVLVIVAVARPAATVTLASRRGTVMLAMDVSGSMRAADVNPTRISAAQIAAKNFVKDRPASVKLGIVAFSGAAFVVQPPTTDAAKLNEAIDSLTPERMTAIGAAVLASLQTIFPQVHFDTMLPGFGGEEFTTGMSNNNSTSQGVPLASDTKNNKPQQQASKTPPVEPASFKSAAVILMTDGKNTDGPDPIEAARIAANFGVRVFTIGFGTPNGTITTFWGRTMHVVLDEDTLKRMANITHAQYFHAQTEAELSKIYKNLNTKLQQETETREITSFFALAATILAAASIGLSMLWFGRII
jgi:Ca-activated chloride channel homolog